MRVAELLHAATVAIVGALGYGTIESRVMRLVDDYERVAAGQYNNSLGQRLRIETPGGGGHGRAD